jgi:hypothetical protein
MVTDRIWVVGSDGRRNAPRRGDWVQTLCGPGGRYVGTSPNDVDWIAYRPEDFRGMCAAFDAERFGRRTPAEGGASAGPVEADAGSRS